MSSDPDLDAYFERIGYDGSPQPDERTLIELHTAHLCTIPYENLDIQLGEKKALDETRFLEKLAHGRRGGWCYEMNGTFSVVLRRLGFRVDRVGGAVARHLIGDEAIGNHMVLIVTLGDRPIVADVGVGDGPLLPFPLEEREWTEDGFRYALGRVEDGWWRFTNHEHGLAPTFDFTTEPRALDWYRDQATKLQTGDASVFTQLAMTFRRDRRRVRALRETTYIEQALAVGAQVYITGEASEQTVHIAREEGIHFIAAGHHATERYGVQALGEAISEKLDLEHRFIDIDNPV